MASVRFMLSPEMPDDWSHEETNDPLYADRRNFYKVELRDRPHRHTLANNNQELGHWGRIMVYRGRFDTITCPNCNALYQLVKVEAGPKTEDREIACPVCGA